MKISVVSRKGGVGKTTIAIHLAAALSKNGRKKTLLIDGDPNRCAFFWTEGVKVPFSVTTPQEANPEGFDHIVIDTEARPKIEDLEVLSDFSDLILFPATPDLLSLDVLITTIQDLKRLDANYTALLNIIPPPPSRAGEKARQALIERNIPTLKHGIRRYVAYQKAVFKGLIVNKVKDPRAAVAWSDCLKVTKELEQMA